MDDKADNSLSHIVSVLLGIIYIENLLQRLWVVLVHSKITLCYYCHTMMEAIEKFPTV